MALKSGTRLGPYEIVTSLGAGGMGEVYRARDTVLNREIALKFLPEPFVADPERLARFTREAQALAALNHPNIAHVYGLERSEKAGAREASDQPLAFIAMELVEGEDLAQRITRGPIPVDEALAIAKQIAEALEAAHEHGLVHRDLKPANIKVRPDGTVKILDFGLAKAVEQTGADALSMSPTLTSPVGITMAGVILGTAAYMAPEQAKGRSVDKRADIWAFGVVLYEMLTGRRPFAAETVVETVGLVVTAEPDWTALPSHVPARVGALIRRCLSKDPRERLRDIGEARILLTRPDDPVSTPSAVSSNRRMTWVGAAGAIAAFAIGAVSTFVVNRRAAAPGSSPIRRFELPAGIAAASAGPVISPDGSRLAYVAGNHLRVQVLDSIESQDLGPTPVTTDHLFWSPDSETIGLTADATIRSIPATGGPTFVICQIPASGRAYDLVWRADGTILFSVFRDNLYAVTARGGTPSTFLSLDRSTEVDIHRLSRLPDDRLIIGIHIAGRVGERYELYDGKRRTLLSSDPGAEGFVYVRPGYLLFVRTDANKGIWALPFTDGPLDLSKAVRVQPESIGFTAAVDGTLVASVRPSTQSKIELAWVDRRGVITAIPGQPVDVKEPDAGWYGRTYGLSPDGTRVAFIAGASNDVFVRDLASGLDTRLTFDQRVRYGVSWTPTADRVLYVNGVDVKPGTAGSFVGTVVFQRADGSETPRDLMTGTMIPRISPDGKSLLVLVDETGRGHLKIAPIRGDGSIGTVRPFFSSADQPHVRSFDISPDGRLLAYAEVDPSQRRDVFLTEFPSGTGRWQVRQGGNAPKFSPDGHELFYVSESPGSRGEATGQLHVVPIASASAVRFGAATVLFDVDGPQTPYLSAIGYDVSRDGRILSSRLIAPTGQTTRRVVLIQNWIAALQE